MKTYIQKVIATTAVTGVLLSGIVGVHAMSDDEFKAQILKQIQLEENISPEELALIGVELEGISQNDILSSLKEEIDNLEKGALKTELIKLLASTQKISDGEKFFTAIDAIYTKLDAYYEENQVMPDWEFDFKDMRKDIIQGVNEEQKLIKDTELKAKFSDTIKKLEKETDEEKFFNILDALYQDEVLNKYYETQGFTFAGDFGINGEDILPGDPFYINMNGSSIAIGEYYPTDMGSEDMEFPDWEFSFEDLKKDMIEGVKKEQQLIKDAKLKAKFSDTIKKLEKETDEEEFFNILDALYQDESLNKYYEESGVMIIEGGEFLGEEFNFGEEKDFIIESVEMEIGEIDNTKLKKELEADFKKLKIEKNQKIFFSLLDKMYKKIDAHYGVSYEDFPFDGIEEGMEVYPIGGGEWDIDDADAR